MIRQRPDNQKKFFALITALILTLIIVGFWFSFSNNSSENQIAGGNQDKLSSLSPWQVIKDEFSKAFSGLNNEISDQASTSPIVTEVIPEDLSTSTGSTTTDTAVNTNIAATIGNTYQAEATTGQATNNN